MLFNVLETLEEFKVSLWVYRMLNHKSCCPCFFYIGAHEESVTYCKQHFSGNSYYQLKFKIMSPPKHYPLTSGGVRSVEC